MRKVLLLMTTMLLSMSTLFGQTPTSIQCTLTIDQISEAQPFDVDHPKQEETREIAENLISEITIVYDLLNQGDTSSVANHTAAIEALVDQATLLGMNYSMFQADLNYIESLN